MIQPSISGELLYCSTIDVLQHLCFTRPYTNFVVDTFSQYMQVPILCPWEVGNHELQYLKGTLDHVMVFKSNPIPSNEVSFVPYDDPDLGGDLVDRNSVSIHFVLQNGNPIVLNEKKSINGF